VQALCGQRRGGMGALTLAPACTSGKMAELLLGMVLGPRGWCAGGARMSSRSLRRRPGDGRELVIGCRRRPDRRLLGPISPRRAAPGPCERRGWPPAGARFPGRRDSASSDKSDSRTSRV
jgi:hypothetical protein